MLTQNLFERVLLEPANQSANTLYIVSGYASATMVSRHFIQLIKNKKRVRVELIVGMAIHDGISKKDHTGFLYLTVINTGCVMKIVMGCEVNHIPFFGTKRQIKDMTSKVILYIEYVAPVGFTNRSVQTHTRGELL